MTPIDKLCEALDNLETLATSACATLYSRHATEARAALDHLAVELATVQAKNAELQRRLDRAMLCLDP